MQHSVNHSLPSWYLFILSIGVWSLSIGGHELIGHGGVCAIDPGCDWQYADAMYFDGSRREGVMADLIRAGGSIFNILLALLATVILGRKTNLDHSTRLVLWLILTINLFQSGSYIAFGWLIHPGMDWAILSQRLPSPWGSIAVTFMGGAVILASFILSRRFYPGANRLSQKCKNLVIPVIACACVAVSASLILPTDDRLLMIQGGIGGSIGFLFWMIIQAVLPLPQSMNLSQTNTERQLTENKIAEAEKNRMQIDSHWVYLAISLTLTLLYLLVLSPGLNF